MAFFLTLQVCTCFQTNQLDLVKIIKLICKGMLVKKPGDILSIVEMLKDMLSMIVSISFDFEKHSFCVKKARFC